MAVQTYSKPSTTLQSSFLLTMQINVNVKVAGGAGVIRRLTAAIVGRVRVSELEMKKTI